VVTVGRVVDQRPRRKPQRLPASSADRDHSLRRSEPEVLQFEIFGRRDRVPHEPDHEPLAKPRMPITPGGNAILVNPNG
jgi:hypothetical protein